MRNRTNQILLLALILSVVLRVGAAIYLGNQVVDMPGTADQVSYHNLALRVLGGHGFTFGQAWWPATAANAPTAHWSFLYTGYLVLVYTLFGPHPLVARLIQAVLVGLLQPYLAFWLGRRLFGTAVGLAGAILTAVYAYFIYYSANLMTEPFYITAILASFVVAFQMVDPQRWAAPEKGNLGSSVKWGLLLGLSLGAAVLLRQLFLLLIPLIFLWLLLNGRRQIPALAVATLLLLAMILPFTAYNYARFGRFVLLNTNAGFAFFWGNHPIYGTHFISILPSSKYRELIPPELLSLDEAALDQALLRRGIQFVLDDPRRYALLSLSRIPDYFMFWPSSDSGQVSNLARVFSFGILWPFMLYGLVLALLQRPAWLQAHPGAGLGLRPPSPLALLLVFMAGYTLIHLLTWTLIRYRLPVDAILVVFAGLALVSLMERIPILRHLLKSTYA